MALTVASAALDTNWAEFGLVSIPAGTLADMSACIDHVWAKLNRGTVSATSVPSDAQINEWLIRGKEELVEIKNFTFKRRYVTGSTVADQYRYSLPQDFAGGDISVVDKTNDRRISLWTESIFDTKYPDPSEESSDEPRIGCIKNRELWLVPPPAGVYVIELRYDRSGDDETPADIAWLPEIERFRICDFATAEAFSMLEQLDRAAFYYDRWNQGLRKAIRADGKRKWHRMGHQAISIFQHNAAINSQPDEI